MKNGEKIEGLHLGCGLVTPPGWVNVDGSINARLSKWPRLRALLGKLRIIPRSSIKVPWHPGIVLADLRRPLPWRDGEFAAVYCSHVLEHVYLDEAINLLRESFRVLRPGGVCRFVVPDLQAIIEDYVARDVVFLAPGNGSVAVNRANEFCTRMMMRRPDSGGGFWKRLYHHFNDFDKHKWMWDAESLSAAMTSVGLADARPRGYLDSHIPSIAGIEVENRVRGGGLVIEAVKPGGASPEPRPPMMT